jgi:FdhD protein
MTSRLDRRPGPSVRTRVVEYVDGERREHEDRLATEEPLEIRVTWPGAEPRRVAVTMRTPGHDFELAVGWLVHEGVLGPTQVATVRYCTDSDLGPLEEFNVVTVESHAPPSRLPEPRAVSSACGVCGKESIADVLDRTPSPGGEPPDDARISLDLVRGLPGRLREEQPGFDRTGGLHAAGLFEADGTRVVVREDVGRHNAVDKAVGALLLGTAHASTRPALLVLSGRVGFELVQKAVVSGIGVVVAVGAPSSLAVSLAERAGIALVGFTRPDRCVVYAGDHRLGV